jgi:hypothetical protein
LGLILQIKDYRHEAEIENECSCHAAKARQEVFLRELADLESEACQILRLENLQRPLPKRVRRPGQQWDYIYSSGLLATLPQVAARQVVRKATSCLKPGGHLLFANVIFKAGELGCPVCDSRRWVHRTEYDMSDLITRVPDNLVSGLAVFRDAPGLNVYLELYRR